MTITGRGLSKAIYQAIDCEILDERAITMDEDQWVTSSTFDVVQSYSVHVDELTNGRVLSFSLLGPQNVINSSRSKRRSRPHQSNARPAFQHCARARILVVTRRVGP